MSQSQHAISTQSIGNKVVIDKLCEKRGVSIQERKTYVENKETIIDSVAVKTQCETPVANPTPNFPVITPKMIA
jgi:hypothetical protein